MAVWSAGSLPATRSLRRCSARAPALALGLCWAAYYFSAGYGMRGTSWYRELSDPGTAIVQGLADLPLWIDALFGTGMLNLALTVPPSVARLLALPLAIALLWLLLPAARATKPLRFFALATALSLAPMLLTVPQDRHALSASFASLGWLAGFIAGAAASTRAWVRGAAKLLVAINVWIALLNFPLQLRSTRPAELAIQSPTGRIFCALRDMPRANEIRRVSGMSIRVLQLNERGLPKQVRFELDTPLEDEARAWLVWSGRAPARWQPPAIGQRVTLAATPFLDSLPFWTW